MKSLVATLSFVALSLNAGCEARAQRDDQTNATIRRIVADGQQREASVWEARKAQAAAHQAEVRKKEADDAALLQRVQQGKHEALESECSQTRVDRLRDVKLQIAEWHKRLRELLPHADWVVKHCKEDDTRGVLVSRKRTADGVLIRTRAVGSEAEVVCDAKLPKGLDMGDVNSIVSLEKSGVENLKLPLYDGQFEAVNERCAELDRAQGLDLFVRLRDVDGQRALLAK